MTTPRTRRAAALVLAIASAVVGLLLGQSYIDRLPHHAGYFLVPVADEVRVPLSKRPRHTAFIVVDGLRRDAAETMSVTQDLLRLGQCRISDQGSWTVSRPVYALLSTGLEVDRTGARNNDLTAPLAAESVWQVARAHGLRVSGSSHLPWFSQLFPAGFDRFATAESHRDDVFFGAELLDVNLFHPLYVDEAGHRHGGASPEYAVSVARADHEIARLLARLDLTQDLVIFTADHGHRAEGGHGGAQPEIKDVLVCFAGLNVARRADRAPFDGRTTAPALATLLGLPFPRHMRAGDDGLDAIWEIASFGDADRAYVEERRAAVGHFRDENRAELERSLGGAPGNWSRLYAREAQAQTIRGLLLVTIAAAFVAFRLRGARRRGERALVSAGWLAFALLVVWGVHRAGLGELDFTVINLKVRYVPRAFGVVGVAALVSAGVHTAVVRRAGHRASDMLTLVGLMLATMTSTSAKRP